MNLINQFQTSLERQVIDRLQGPLESVRGLPNYAFTSDDFYALEQEKLFSRTWVFAGRLSEVPNIFFIHLKRIVFNYDMFVNMKIHTRLQFPN